MHRGLPDKNNLVLRLSELDMHIANLPETLQIPELDIQHIHFFIQQTDLSDNRAVRRTIARIFDLFKFVVCLS